jgi:hypothetical protein
VSSAVTVGPRQTEPRARRRNPGGTRFHRGRLVVGHGVILHRRGDSSGRFSRARRRRSGARRRQARPSPGSGRWVGATGRRHRSAGDGTTAGGLSLRCRSPAAVPITHDHTIDACVTPVTRLINSDETTPYPVSARLASATAGRGRVGSSASSWNWECRGCGTRQRPPPGRVGRALLMRPAGRGVRGVAPASRSGLSRLNLCAFISRSADVSERPSLSGFTSSLLGLGSPRPGPHPSRGRGVDLVSASSRRPERRCR